MAPSKPAVDFNAMINAGTKIRSRANSLRISFTDCRCVDRQRRKNEALAQEVFSKGRRSSAPGAGMNNRKPGTGPSLASRIGVAGVAKVFLRAAA